MRGSSSLRALALGAAFPVAALLAPLGAQAQQPVPATVWPDPPSARPAPPPAAPGQPASPTRPRRPAAQAPADPAAAPARPRPAAVAPADPAAGPGSQARLRPAAPALNVRCDGPFAKDGSHDKLAAAFGAKNVVAQSGSTIVFPNDPKRRLEVTWNDAAARQRPAAIIIEGQSTWRARGFRIGEPLANVEKTNGQPFTLMGFSGEAGGSAKNWQGGALDKLSGGCQLGMRFAPAPNTSADARAKVSADGDLTSSSPEVRAVKPAIAELIVGYPE